jgi:ABC-2 type transport system permease protein
VSSVEVRRADPTAPATARPPATAPRYAASLAAVYTGQLARVRVARGPLLFVATLQSVGILVLLRGVVAAGDTRAGAQIVAGSTVLVVAFVGLNLLAQRFGMLKGTGALDYYAALPVRPSAVVLGTAASYATFTIPGTVVTAVVGVAVYRLPFAPLVLLPPVVVLAGASLAGLGALLGLALPRPELATVAGQLGMSAVVFLDLVPAARFPWPVQALRAVVPSTYAADALAAAFRPRPDWPLVAADLGVCAGVALAALALAAVAFHRATSR